ncbi:MAG: hypothetical protein ACOY0T_14640 [Myxococcota bacterium]
MRAAVFPAGVAVLLALAACNAILGIEEHERATGSSGGSGGSGNSNGGGKSSSQGGRGGNGSGGTGEAGTGANPQAGGPGGGEAGAPAQQCVLGSRSCQGNTVVECDAAGNWVAVPPAEQCGGTKPACTGAGLCASLRLREGTIDTFSVYPPEANGPTYILVHQSLLSFPKVCSANYCVTGGVRP